MRNRLSKVLISQENFTKRTLFHAATTAMDTLSERLAAQNSNTAAATYDAKKVEISALKTVVSRFTSIPNNGPKLLGGSAEVAGTTTATNMPSKLNEFLLAQLNEKRNNGEISNSGFTLPKLHLGGGPPSSEVRSTLGANQFVIPLLKINAKHSNISTANIATLSNDLQSLKVADNSGSEKPAIDLTTALSSANGHLSSASRLEARNKTEVVDFYIPFIECDRREVRQTVLLPTANDYCQTDISNTKLRHCLVAPSSCGRILCLHYKRTQPYVRIDHSFQEKYKIQQFHFDTMSPDEKVLATLGKYQRL